VVVAPKECHGLRCEGGCRHILRLDICDRGCERREVNQCESYPVPYMSDAPWYLSDTGNLVIMTPGELLEYIGRFRQVREWSLLIRRSSVM
jgi:hypothetical protein